MVFVGIDPGIASVGYGVVDYTGGKLRALEYGTFRTPAHTELSVRLREIYEFLIGLFSRHQPAAVAVEELFFNTNAKTALMVGHGRGVILLAAEMDGRRVFSYTPLQVKQAVVGYGRAEKEQVQHMVKMLLGLAETPRPDDTADALAMAICHAHSSGSQMLGIK